MLHRIRRQILELELPREQGAYALQQRASRVFQEQVLPELDRLFSRIAPADRIVRLDRLEVDLGDIGESGWERRFVEQCLEKIARQVADAAFEVGEAGAQPETLAPEENVRRVVAYFLETGLLPWHAKGLTLNGLEQELSALPAEVLAGFGRSLLPLFQHDERRVQRLAQQFSPVFSEKIVAAALGLDLGWVSRVVQIRQQQTGRVLGRSQRAVFFQQLLRLGGTALQDLPPEPTVLAQVFEAEIPQSARPKAAAEDRSPAAGLTKNAVREAGAPKPTPANKLDEPPPTALPTKKTAAQAPDGSSGGILKDTNPSTDVPELRKTEHLGEWEEADFVRQIQTDLPPGESALEKRPTRFPEAPKPTPRKVVAAIAEGIAVESAGLVLFASYLSVFFEHLGLQLAAAELPESLTEDSPQTRAVHLLHYLSTGETWPEEQQLVFPKILCGIPLEMPVPQELELSDLERTEAENLLEAVVRNWPALKNTSTDGLRNGFVRRNGQVRWQDDRQAWVLQVERMAQDILLDRLPWTISVVKLPWMTGMVQVEW